MNWSFSRRHACARKPSVLVFLLDMTDLKMIWAEDAKCHSDQQPSARVDAGSDRFAQFEKQGEVTLQILRDQEVFLYMLVAAFAETGGDIGVG